MTNDVRTTGDTNRYTSQCAYCRSGVQTADRRQFAEQENSQRYYARISSNSYCDGDIPDALLQDVAYSQEFQSRIVFKRFFSQVNFLQQKFFSLRKERLFIKFILLQIVARIENSGGGESHVNEKAHRCFLVSFIQSVIQALYDVRQPDSDYSSTLCFNNAESYCPKFGLLNLLNQKKILSTFSQKVLRIHFKEPKEASTKVTCCAL